MLAPAHCRLYLCLGVLLNIQDSLGDLADGSYVCSDALWQTQVVRLEIVSRDDPLRECSVKVRSLAISDDGGGCSCSGSVCCSARPGLS